MNMKIPLIHRSGLVFSVLAALTAGIVAADVKENVSLNGYGCWLAGQIVQGTSEDSYAHQWLNSAMAGFTLTGRPSERLTVILRPEFKIYYPLPLGSTINTRRMRAVRDVREVNGNLVFGDINNPYAELRLGIFHYKYNPDVKDFGEYLFRTGTYPPYAVNNFDFTAARLCGMQLRVNPVANLTVDALFLSELEFYPLYDFSLAFLARYKVLNAFDFGAGVDFARILPIDPRKTTVSDKTPNLSGNAADFISYKKDSFDSLYSGTYSFKAIKLMLHMGVDPKSLLSHLPFMPELDFFGKEDLKLYGEVVLTGLPVKSVPDLDHPDLYGDISRLMPMVAGFNFPAFKVLDVLAFEVEYFPSKMPNNYGVTAGNSAPLPDILELLRARSYNPDDYKERNLGWAIYARKEVVKGFSIVGQVSYDHMRLPGEDGYDAPYEAMTRHGDWAWVSKVQFSF